VSKVCSLRMLRTPSLVNPGQCVSQDRPSFVVYLFSPLGIKGGGCIDEKSSVVVVVVVVLRGVRYQYSLAKCPCVATALEKIYIFMTLENNMLAFTHFLRALSLHIELSCSSTNYVGEKKTCRLLSK
jgi:hypothetical protein